MTTYPSGCVARRELYFLVSHVMRCIENRSPKKKIKLHPYSTAHTNDVKQTKSATKAQGRWALNGGCKDQDRCPGVPCALAAQACGDCPSRNVRRGNDGEQQRYSLSHQRPQQVMYSRSRSFLRQLLHTFHFVVRAPLSPHLSPWDEKNVGIYHAP